MSEDVSALAPIDEGGGDGVDDPAQRKYVCKICSKTFKRSEHCKRHQRAHTQERPFSCQYCHKRYNRKDLVLRHERTLHAEQHALNNGAENGDSKHPPAKKAKLKAGKPEEEEEAPLESAQLESADDDLQAEAFVPPAATANDQGQFTWADNTMNSMAAPISTHAGRPSISRRSQSFHQQMSPVGIVDFTSVTADNSLNHDLNVMSMGFEMPALDFFDPFLGSTYDQFALPVLPSGSQLFSPPGSLDSQSVDGHGQPLPTPPIPSATQANNSWQDVEQHSQHNLDSILRLSSTTQAQNSAKNQPQNKIASKAPTQAPGKQTKLLYTDQSHRHTWADLRGRVDSKTLEAYTLPSAGAMQKWLAVYVEAFHVHFPFIHLPSLDFDRTPSPLTMAICAIGALYRLNRTAALKLYGMSVQCLMTAEPPVLGLVLKSRLLEDWPRPSETSKEPNVQPLWHTQARLLCLIFAAFSGEPVLVRKSFEDLGSLAWDYRRRLLQIKTSSTGGPPQSWKQWVDRESTKRVIHMMFIFSNLLNITYGVPPGFCLSEDGGIEMPGSEPLWQATSEEEWLHLRSNGGTSESRPVTLREAAGTLMNDSASTPTTSVHSWSPFGVCLAIHAVCTQIWHMSQSVMPGGGLGKSNNKADTSSSADDDTDVILGKRAQAALNRCRNLLLELHQASNSSGSTNSNTTATDKTTAADAVSFESTAPPSYTSTSPLLFNSFAILRVAFSRAFTGVRLADRELLLHESASTIKTAIDEYIRLPPERSEFTTKAIERSFEGLVIPFQTSALLVRKTAALTWSIEHALAGWDAALFVCKWIFDTERMQARGGQEALTSAEKGLLARVKLLVDEEEYGSSARMLASSLVRLWAAFYDDTWVWGVTPRIGWVLRRLADAFEAMAATG